MIQRYDMVFAVGTDIQRQFNFDVNMLGDRGLLDYDFKMQVRKNHDGPVIAEFSKSNGSLIVQHSRVFLTVPETAQFDLSGLDRDYVSEPIPSPDDPISVYAAYAHYDLISVSPDGVHTRELYGRIGFDLGITQVGSV